MTINSIQPKKLVKSLWGNVRWQYSIREGQIQFLTAYMIIFFLCSIIGTFILNSNEIEVTSKFLESIFMGLLQVYASVIAVTFTILAILARYYPRKHLYNYLLHPYFLFLSGAMIISMALYSMLRVLGGPEAAIEAFVLNSLLSIIFVAPYLMAMVRELQPGRLKAYIFPIWEKEAKDLRNEITNAESNQDPHRFFSYSNEVFKTIVTNEELPESTVRNLLGDFRNILGSNIDSITSSGTDHGAKIENYFNVVTQETYVPLMEWAAQEEEYRVAITISLEYLKMIITILEHMDGGLNDPDIEIVAQQILINVANHLEDLERIDVKQRHLYEFDSIIGQLDEGGERSYNPELNRIRNSVGLEIH